MVNDTTNKQLQVNRMDYLTTQSYSQPSHLPYLMDYLRREWVVECNSSYVGVKVGQILSSFPLNHIRV
jgi:hypothetical protein